MYTFSPKKVLSGLLACLISLESVISILLVSSVTIASVETTFATPSSYSKKAYLQVASGTIGAAPELESGNWYMTTPATTVSPGDSVKYVLDMSSASADMAGNDFSVSDYLALGHTWVTNIDIPEGSGWSLSGGIVPGTPNTIATWNHLSGAVRNVQSSGALQWIDGQNKQAGNISGGLPTTANPLTLSGIQSLAGLDSSTTDGFTSQTLINGSGDVIIFSVSHNHDILIRAANMTNGVYTSVPFASGTGYTSENNGVILQDTTNSNKIYILRHDNVYACYDISRNPSHAATACSPATFGISPVSFTPRTSSGAWLPSSTAFAIVADRLYAWVLGTDGDTYLTCTTTAWSHCGEWLVGTGTDFGTTFHKHSTQLTTEKFAFALSNGLQYCIREVASGSLALCDGTSLPPSGADITSSARNIGTAGWLFYPPPGSAVRLGWAVFPRVENGTITGYCYSDKTASYTGNNAVCRDLSDALVPTDTPQGPNFHSVAAIIPNSSRILINHSSTSGYFDPLPICYDFSTHSTCNGTLNLRQDEYGGAFISPTCYVTMDDGATYGNISSFALYQYGTGGAWESNMTRLGTPVGTLTGELYHNGAGYQPTGNMATNEYSYSQSDVDACNAGWALDIPSTPSTEKTIIIETQDPLHASTCQPGTETVEWDTLTISGIPVGFTSATGTLLDMSGNTLAVYGFDPSIPFSQSLVGQVSHSSVPTFQIRLDVAGTGTSLDTTHIELTHTSDRIWPQICYDATITQAICDAPHPVSSGPLDPLDFWVGTGTWSPNMFATVSVFGALHASTPILLTDGAQNVGVSCAPVEIGGTFWKDMDHDGIQNISEMQISSVDLGLFDPLGNLVATGTTDASGSYLFSNTLGTNTPSSIYGLTLPATATGYTIRIANGEWSVTGTLSGLTPTVAHQWGDTTLDSDLALLSGGLLGTTLTLPALGMSDYSYDFGVFPDIEIGDRVWNDMNANGIQDGGENNIMNATVELLDASGAVIASALTDPFGNYAFTSNAITGSTSSFVSNLPLDLSGSYFVRLAASNFTPWNTLDTAMGWTVSPGSRWSDPTLDSDVDITLPTNSIALGYTTMVLHPFGFSLVNGRYVLHDTDFGAYLGFDISLKKYIDTPTPTGDADTSGSGVYEGYSGSMNYIIRVTNIGPGQTHGETVVTDTLPSGVSIAGTPSGAGWSCAQIGADLTCRSTDTVLGSSSYSDISIPVIVTAKDAVLTNTALATNLEELPGVTANNTDPAVALIVPVVVGDRVWYDTNRNGIQDGGENGLAWVSVSLIDASGAIIATATTSVSGIYAFSSESGSTSGDGSYVRDLPLIPGTNYTIRVNATNFTSGTLSGSYQISPSGQATSTTDSDGQSGSALAVSGVSSFLFSLPPVSASVGARTDTSHDFGVYQDFDLSVKKYLSASWGSLQDANTAATGSTSANSFGYGDMVLYTLTVSNVWPGPALGTTYVADTLPSGVTIDSSFAPPSVWNCTTSGQNILCSTATGVVAWGSLPNIVIPVRVTTMDATGGSSLTNTVSVSNSAEVSTAHNPANAGNPSNPGNPSDPNAPNPSTPEGQNNTDVAVMSIYPVAIGDRIWYDTNRNGIQDSGENGIPSVVVDLSFSGTTIATVTTNASGSFLFSSATGSTASWQYYGIPFVPGSTGYTIALRASNFLSGGVLSGLVPTTALAGSDTTRDSNLSSLSTISVTLPARWVVDISYDAGLMAPAPQSPSAWPGGGPWPAYVPPTTSTPVSTSQFQQPFIPIGIQTIFVPPTPKKDPIKPRIQAEPSLEYYPYGPAGDQSLLPNDRVNGALATTKNVTVTLLDNGGIKGLTLDPKTGKILFPPKTAPGKYTVSYAITDTSDASNKAESIAVIIIERAKPTFVLPKKLLDTGTPIAKKWIRIIANFLVATKAMFPSAYGFAHAEDAPRDITFWKKHLFETLGDKYQEKDGNAASYIVVPSIGIVTPVYDILDSSEKSKQKDFDTLVSWGEINVNPYTHDGVVHYPRSAGAGEVGNMVVAGHSSYWKADRGRYKTVFGNLMELDAGEEVWVYTKSSIEKSGYILHRYRVTASYNTDPTNVGVLLPDWTKSTITLFTCTPVGGLAGRWIIRGELID